MYEIARAIMSRWVTPLWPVTVVGILVGAAIGGLALQATTLSQATALVRLHMPIDPDQIMTGTAPSSDTEQSYISGEVTYLNSPGFAVAVAKELGEPDPPELSATQGIQSSVVALSTTDADPAIAARTVDAALTTYHNRIQQEARERGQAAIDAINGVITGLQREQTEPPAGTAPTGTEQQALAQLIAQRSSIEAQTARPAPMDVVDGPTTVQRVAGAPSWSLSVLGGGLLGGLVALALALAWRKQLGILASRSALENHINHVLAPTLHLGQLTEADERYTGLARSLYAQLPAPRSGRILLVGASADSGTRDVARLIAHAATEHIEVAVVSLVDAVETASWPEVLSDVPDGATVVIDGGSLASSPALTSAAEDASQMIVVAMIGHDTADSVQMTARLANDTGIPVCAVGTRRGLRKAKSPEPFPQPTSRRVSALDNGNGLFGSTTGQGSSTWR